MALARSPVDPWIPHRGVHLATWMETGMLPWWRQERPCRSSLDWVYAVPRAGSVPDRGHRRWWAVSVYECSYVVRVRNTRQACRNTAVRATRLRRLCYHGFRLLLSLPTTRIGISPGRAYCIWSFFLFTRTSKRVRREGGGTRGRRGAQTPYSTA